MMVSLEDFCRIRFGRNFFSLPREYVQSHRITRVMQDTHTHTHSIHIYIHTYTHLLKFITESVHTRSFSFPLRFVSNKRWGNKKEKKKKRCFAKFPKKKLKWRNDEFNIFVTNSRYTTNSSYWLCAGTIARKKEKRESSNWALDYHVCNTYTQITHTHT